MYPQRSVMTCGLATALKPPHFNPRTRVGCNRARMAGYGRFHASFNPRTRVECDCACPADACAKCCFNPRTRVGCDGMTFYRSCVGGGFQSTHPRRVRPRGQHPADLLRRVSIHAPAWGATFSLPCKRLVEEVSIHAPAWGATLSCRLMSGLSARFQSTHPRGVRRHAFLHDELVDGFQSTHPRGVRHSSVYSLTSRLMFQSTHPRGVRLVTALFEISLVCFNPRTRVGCDIARPMFCPTSDKFQSTHPRGVRPVVGDSPDFSFLRFNPRTRVGCDLITWLSPPVSRILFQSTHPRGVRLKQRLMLARTLNWFQSTHPRGVRRLLSGCGTIWVSGFNPRTRVGCDESYVSGEFRSILFQSTHPRGVRLGGWGSIMTRS